MSHTALSLPTMYSNHNTLNQHDKNWQGDEISNEKDSRYTRIMFHNVNGLTLQGPEGIDIFINDQASLHVDIQGISEHCLDTTKFQVTYKANEIIRQNYSGQALVQWDSSTEPALHQYKPGGTGLIMVGPVIGRLEPNGKGGDSMGRWSFVHLRRKAKAPLTIISAYQVCPRPTNRIGNTAYHQQQRALNLAGQHNVHPRRAFIHDLSIFVSTLRQQHHEIILGGDFNEALNDRNSGIHQLATNNNLVDPFLMRFPHCEDFGTHSNGKRRIDIVLVSPGLCDTVKNIGYAPFNFINRSDHRPIVLDFLTERLFGEHNESMQRSIHRSVRSNDRKSVHDFITRMYNEIHMRNGFNYQEEIEKSQASHEVVELVDNIISESGRIAEQKCRRRRPEFYSQPLTQKRITVSILRGHLNALKSGKDRTSQLTNRMVRANIAVELPMTQHLTKIALQEARASLQDILKENETLRKQELDQRIENAKSRGDRQKEKILRSIQKVETGKRTYRLLKAMRTPTSISKSLDRIEIPASWPPPQSSDIPIDTLEDPKQCTTWRQITNPQDIEYYLMMRNRLHFGQAEGTPLTRPPLLHDFDWAATSLASEELLLGTYSTSSDTSKCHDLLEACRFITEPDSIPYEFTMEEFRGKISSWRETTTTSPSGRHLGQYKALFARGLPVENEENHSQLFSSQQKAIAQLILTVMNYCIRENYVLERWKTIVNVMIFKEQMNYKIHRLRVIHIYEADFNMILAVKWRELLRKADTKELINAGQYGGRPGCEAQSLTLLEELKYDLSYLTRRSLINFDNDATSCYDRILVPLASLINRKYGMHRQLVAIHANTLHQARFRLKTATGVSDLSYSHCAQYPIHGTGQGSGNSPCIWLFISSTLFDIHLQQSQGISFVSPNGQHKVRMSMVGFVDDSTGSCNDFRPATQLPLTQLLKTMERDAQKWNDLLYSSGGKLELPKCSFHALHFEFRPDGTPIASIDSYDGVINIVDDTTGDTIPIPAKRAFDFHKTLGHHKSPITATRLVLQNLQEKANRLALTISLCPITRQGAYLAYHTVFIPTIKYTLPQSFYPMNQLQQAQAQSTAKLLSKCGYNRNTARALVYAPLNYAGCGFIPWHVLQGEGQLQHFVKHWRTNTIISKTLRIATQWAQWQSGHENSILVDTHTPIPYLECRWLRSVRQFMASIRASFQLDIPLVIPPERRKDIYIMQYARECGLFSNKDLAIINYCRLYLHATTLSELFDASGKTILPNVFHCQREAWFDPNTYITLQRRPSDYQVRTKWQRLCRQWSTDEGHLAASMSLGSWITSGHLLRRRRQTYKVHTPTLTIYHWHQTCYWECALVKGQTQYRLLKPTQWEPTVPCTPVTVQISLQRHLFLSITRQAIPHSPRLAIPKNFEQYVNTLHDWERHLLQGIQFHLSPYEIHHQITKSPRNISMYLVSDGSQKGSELSFGWVWGSSQGTIYAEHSGTGFGKPTSHRAEAWAMLSGALFIAQLHKYMFGNSPQTPHSRTIIFFSDNAGLIQRIKQRRTYKIAYPNSTLATDWDLIEQLNSTWQDIPFENIMHEWVLGHQDPTSDDLPIEARYNIQADKLAGTVRHPRAPIPHPTWMLPSEKCRLLINDIPIQSYYTDAIRQAAALPPYFAYLQQRHNWGANTQYLVDWSIYKSAVKTCQISNVQLMKLVHHKLPTQYEIAKSNPNVDPTCRYCGTKETFTHFLQCCNPHAQNFRDDLMEKMENYFTTRQAPQPVRHIWFMSTQFWLEKPSHPCDLGHDHPQCLHDQHQIGWNLLPCGFISTRWRALFETAQAPDMQSTRSEAKGFFTGLITLLWKCQLTYWNEHNDSTKKDLVGAAWHISDKRYEYQTRIRQLHTQKMACMPGHRDQYFYEDVEDFLSQASLQQMKSYLHHYEVVIYRSIREAKNIQTRPIFSFPGFTFHQQPSRRQPSTLTQDQTKVSRTNLTLNDRMGDQLLRKHTRWRNVSSSVRSIKEFFYPSLPT